MDTTDSNAEPMKVFVVNQETLMDHALKMLVGAVVVGAVSAGPKVMGSVVTKWRKRKEGKSEPDNQE